MQKVNHRLLLAALSGLLALSGCHANNSGSASSSTPANTASADQGKAAVTVNGEVVPQSMVDQMVQERVAQGQPATPDAIQAAKDDLVTRTLVAQAAVTQGLDKQTDTANQLTLARNTVLARAYLQNYVKAHPVSDAQMQTEYNKMKQQVGDKEYQVRHILVDNPQLAQDLIKKLNNGGNFSQLAKQYSKDPGSKDNGGELSWITPGSVVKPFGDAVTHLQKGQVTQQPVKTDYGYHVIQLEDIRPLQAPPFDQVKPQLQQRMQQEQVQKALNDLKAKAKIEDNTPAPKADNSAAAASPAAGNTAAPADNAAAK